MSGPRNLLAEWSALLLRSLAAAGVRDVILSPGSRSTPFVLAAADCAAAGLLRLHDVIDERAAAFHALGLAKATGRPSLLLCTSGTAGAHYLPAVIEAGLAHAPLVILTADRPFELQACAAPQTIDQVKLFGDRARAFYELGQPDESEGALRALRRIAAQAVSLSLAPAAGAVHLNARAKKPLEPPRSGDETPAELQLRALAQAVANEPLVRVFPPRLLPHERGLDELAAACRRARRGVIVAGPAPIAQAAARADLFALCAATGFPLFAEAASQLRFTPRGERDAAHPCDAFNTTLRSRARRDAAAPDLVIQIGAPPTSSALDAWLAAHPTGQRWVLASEGWNDPSSRAHAHLIADPTETARALCARLGDSSDSAAAGRPWRSALAASDAIAWREIDAQLGEEQRENGGRLGEAEAVRAAIDRTPRGALLAIGNSLPIREVDTVCRGAGRDLLVWSQRGANGIDGLIAGAAGAARSGRPTTLLLGDVSALHDVGGLATARGLDVPLVIVVIHNGGGRIFDQLPVAARDDLGARIDHFTTPHSLSLEPAARLYGHRFRAVDRGDDLRAAIDHAHATAGCTLIEARVPPDSAAHTARRLLERIDAAFAKESWPTDRSAP